MIQRPKSGGYAGLVMILLGVLIIGLWIAYFSPLSIPRDQSAPTLEGVDTTRSQGVEAIKRAQDIKEVIESRNRAPD